MLLNTEIQNMLDNLSKFIVDLEMASYQTHKKSQNPFSHIPD